MMETMKRVPLRRRLFLLAAAGILPLAIMSGIALVAGYQQQRDQAEQAGLDVTRALATAVDSELRRTIAVLEVLATSLSLDTGDMAGFSHLAQRAIRTYPHWRAMIDDGPLPPELRSEYALLLDEVGEPDKALAQLMLALRAVPDHPGLLTQRGSVLTRLNQWDEAEADLRKVLKGQPSHPDALHQLGIEVEEGAR